MDEISWEDIKRAKEKREAEPIDYTTIKKKHRKINKNLLEPRLRTILRLWSLRNKLSFTVKELQIFPDDKIETLYKQVREWEEAGYLEKNYHLYNVSSSMRQKLEGMYAFMKSHYHGQGAEIIKQTRKPKPDKIGW